MKSHFWLNYAKMQKYSSIIIVFNNNIKYNNSCSIFELILPTLAIYRKQVCLKLHKEFFHIRFEVQYQMLHLSLLLYFVNSKMTKHKCLFVDCRDFHDSHFSEPTSKEVFTNSSNSLLTHAYFIIKNSCVCI